MFAPITKKTLSDDQKKRFQAAIIFSNWHTDIVQLLVEGAKRACMEHGLSEQNVHYFSVAGAYELPQMAEKLAASKKFQAIIPLGCVIRGETNHYDLIVQTIAAAFDQIGRKHHVPVSFGVLTVENVAQAHERVNGTKGNKGAEAAYAALDLAAEFERVG